MVEGNVLSRRNFLTNVVPGAAAFGLAASGIPGLRPKSAYADPQGEGALIAPEGYINPDLPVGGMMPVDNFLILVVDSSGSIQDPEYQLQRDGIFYALGTPEVREKLLGGTYGRSVLCLIDFASHAYLQQGLSLIGSEMELDMFRLSVKANERKGIIGTETHVFNALDGALEMARFGVAHFEPAHVVVDISGNGEGEYAHKSYGSLLNEKSDRLQKAAKNFEINPWRMGMTINALVMEGYEGPVSKFYRGYVVTPDGKLWRAQTIQDFAETMREKMLDELMANTKPSHYPAHAISPG